MYFPSKSLWSQRNYHFRTGWGGKSVWKCTEELLINKSILSKVRRKKRNLLTIWLDYRKAFDSVPHDWIIKALQLAKVPKNLVKSIKRLTKQCATILNLRGEDRSVPSDEIHYAIGIFQGDSLSIIVYSLSKSAIFYAGTIKRIIIWWWSQIKSYT